MTAARGAAIALAAAVICAAACAAKSTPAVVAPVPPQPPEDRIALLRDEGGSVGRAIVSNGFGSIDLNAAGSLTKVSADRGPSEVTTLTDAAVNAEFGDALSSLPPASQRVTLLFRFESDELTVESAARVSDVVAWVKAYPALKWRSSGTPTRRDRRAAISSSRSGGQNVCATFWWRPAWRRPRLKSRRAARPSQRCPPPMGRSSVAIAALRSP